MSDKERFTVLRVIVTNNDFTLAANIGGPVEITHRTFDVLAPKELVEFLDAEIKHCSRWISGVEVCKWP